MARLSIVLVVLAATSSGAVRSKNAGDRVSVVTAATNVSGSVEDDGTDTECMCKPSGNGAGSNVVQSHQTYKKDLLQAVEQKNGKSMLAPFACKANHDKCSDCVIGKEPCCTVGSDNGVPSPIGCGKHTFAKQNYMNMKCTCGSGMSRKSIFKSNIAKGSGIVAKPTCTPTALCSECCAGGSKLVCDGTYGDKSGQEKMCPKTKVAQAKWDAELEHGNVAREHEPIVTTEQVKAAEQSRTMSSDAELAPAPAQAPTGQWETKNWKGAGKERAAAVAPSSSSLTMKQRKALWESGANQWEGK